MSRFRRQLHPDYPIHVTGRCNNREPFPVPPEVAWAIFEDYLFWLARVYQIELISFVMMSNHFHLLCRDPHSNLSQGMAVFMREISKEMNRLSGRMNRIWGGPFFSSVVSDFNYVSHVYKYNYRNPVAAGLCERVELYPWSTLCVLLGQRRSVIPLTYDEALFADVEGSLAWLNEEYSVTEAGALRTARNRKVFQLPKVASSRRTLRLGGAPSGVPIKAVT